MYDTITLVIPDNQRGYKIPDKYISEHVLNAKFHKQSDTWYSGKHRNMLIVRTRYCLFISGSFTKYVLGNNLEHITISDAAIALNALSDKFKIHLQKSQVSRVDIGFNLPVMQECAKYLLLFKYAIGYKQYRPHPNGVYFSQAEKTMSFYDKGRETKRKNYAFAPIDNSNMLRYELRLKYPSRLLKKAGGIVAMELLEPCIYKTLLAFWVKEYFRVVKNHTMAMPAKISSQKDFTRFLILTGIESLGGESMLHRMVDALNFPHSNNPGKIRNDLRRIVFDAYSHSHLVEKNALGAEVDDLVVTTAMAYSQ